MITPFDQAYATLKKFPELRHVYRPYLDFNVDWLPHNVASGDEDTFSEANVTLSFEGDKPFVYYVMGVSPPTGFDEDVLPPDEHRALLKNHIEALVEKIRAAGVEVNAIHDQTKYPDPDLAEASFSSAMRM